LNAAFEEVSSQGVTAEEMNSKVGWDPDYDDAGRKSLHAEDLVTGDLEILI